MRLRSRDFIAPLRKTPKRLSDLVPWLDLVAPGVVLNDDESLQSTIALTGPDLRAQPPEVQGAAMLQVNNALRQLDKGWSIHSETQRFYELLPEPVDTWGHWVAQAADAEHRERLTREPLLESRHYVTLRYAPPSPKMQRIEAMLYTSDPDEPDAHGWSSYLTMFQTTGRHLATLLRGVMVDVHVLNDEGVWNFLYSVMNRRWRSLKLPEDTHWMAEQLDDDPEDFPGGDRPVHQGQYLRTITVGKFPPTSVAVMLAKLNDLDIEYRWVERWIPFDQYTSEKKLQKEQETHSFHKKALWRQVADRIWEKDPGGERPMAEHNEDELKDAQVVLGTDAASFGSLTVTVTVWDHDWHSSERKIRAVESAINGLGFTSKVESTNAVGALVGSMAGVVKANPRKPTLTSLNASHLMAVDGVYCGPTWNTEWKCLPLFIAKTAKSNPFRYVPHVDGIAHTFFWGPSTMGKSTWKDWLRLMCQQVRDIQDIGYDIKASSMTTTLCLNGRFDDLGRGDVILQPFRYVDRPEELNWAVEWVIKWLKDLTVRIDPYTDRFVRSTLDRLSHVEPSGRTISGFLLVLADRSPRQQVKLHKEDEREAHRIEHSRDRLRTALEPFRGSLLDGAHDGLSIQRVHTFELETLLDTPRMARPILRVVDHQVDQALDGRPTILWYDEIQALLDMEESIETLNARVRRARDKNVMLLAGTQNLEDIMSHQLGPLFLNNCPNKIFLPNPEALSDQNVKSYGALGLTRSQIVQLASALPRAEWLYKSPLGTRLVENRLDPFALAVCGRSGKQWHQEVAKVLAEVGPEQFPVAWLKASEVAHAAAD